MGRTLLVVAAAMAANSAVALALMQGLEAEAAARVEVKARTNFARHRAEVESEWRPARQDQLTTEMIELAAARLPDRG